MSVPIWTATVTDNFQRADTMPYDTPMSTYNVGNGWYDLIGGVWSLQANIAIFLGNAVYFRPSPLVRAFTEIGADQRIIATTEVLTSFSAQRTYGVCLRAQQDAECYFVGFNTAGNLTVNVHQEGNIAVVGPTVAVHPQYGNAYTIDAQIFGSAPSTINAKLLDGQGHVVGQVQVTDSSDRLQHAGAPGLLGNFLDGAGGGFTSATVYARTG